MNMKNQSWILMVLLVAFATGCRDRDAIPRRGGTASGSLPVMSGEEGGLPVFPGMVRAHETHSGALCGAVPCGGRPPFRVTMAHTHAPVEEIVSFYADRFSARPGWREVRVEQTTIYCKEDPADALAAGGLLVPSVTIRGPLREGFPTQVQFIFEMDDVDLDLSAPQ